MFTLIYYNLEHLVVAMAGVVAAKMKAKKQKEEEEEAKVNNELPDSPFKHSTENIALEEREI